MECIKCGNWLWSTNDDFENEICALCKSKEEQSASLQGWMCPRCGQVWSPFVDRCHCPPKTFTASTIDEKI